MRSVHLVRALAALGLSALLTSAAMAEPHPFYATMLQRGIQQVQNGRYDEGVRTLRVAAFGSLDDLGAYQLAQVHLAIAHEKLGNTTEARLAATKFVQAERIRPSYERLALNDSTREAFEKIVAAAVDPQYLAQVPAFRRGAPRNSSAVAARGTESIPVDAVQPRTETVTQPVMPQPQPEKKIEPATAPPPQKPSAPAPQAAKPQVAKPQAPAPMQSAAAQPVINSAKAPAPPAASTPVKTDVQTQVKPAASAPVQSSAPAPVRTAAKAPVQTAVTTPAQAPAPRPTAAPAAPSEVTRRLAEAQRLLEGGKLLAARNAYLALSERRDVARPQVLEIARGLNRTGAWQESAMLYQRALPLVRGEELHMFYEAVNRYELGELTLARTLLGKALPALPQTREIEVYRMKIQGASQ